MANHVSHAALPYPVKGCRFTVQVPYLDADGDPTDPTTPDTERSIDGAAYADCTEEVTTITGGNGSGYITLTGDELNASMVFVAAKVASGPKNTLATLYPRVLPVVRSGTAQAGAAGTITLDSGASAIDDYYNGMIVRTTGGTGGGGGSGSLNNQARMITDYVGSTKVASVSPNWETNPDSTTTFEVLVTELALLRYGDLQAWRGTQPNTLLSGRVDANMQAAANDVITAAVIADNAIDAGAIAANAITSAKIATDAIGAAQIAADAIGASELAADAAGEVADAVWDELQSGHLIAGSFGQLNQDIRNGTAQAGGVNSITLDAGANGTDDFYNNTVVLIVSGTGAKQIRYISDYVGSTKQAVVAPNWITNPDATSVFVILPLQQWAEVTNSRISDSVWNDLMENRVVAGSAAQALKPIRMGSAQAGALSTITLDSGASAVDDFYNNTIVYVEAGVGSRQVRLIRDYVGSTKVATVTPNWVTDPGLNSQFVIYPDGLQNLATWLSVVPNALIAGRVDANMQAAGADVITASVIATDAIGASEFAQAAADKVWSSATRTLTAFSTALALSVWDVLESAIVAASSIGLKVKNNLDAAITTRATPAQVNTEVVDGLNVDTYAEIGQETPAATQSIRKMLAFLYKAWRNRTTQTASQYSLYGDDAVTIHQKATFSDNGTTADRGEVATGP